MCVFLFVKKLLIAGAIVAFVGILFLFFGVNAYVGTINAHFPANCDSCLPAYLRLKGSIPFNFT